MNISEWSGNAISKSMKTYRVRISRKSWRDVEELSDYLLTVISIEGARKYLDTMIAEVQSLALFADLYRPSTMADIRQYHPKARRMVSHNPVGSISSTSRTTL